LVGIHATVVVVGADGTDPLTVTRCGECGSLATDRPPLEMTETGPAIDSYVEATAGIATIAERLLLVDPHEVDSLLDVGCGYGFGADLGRFLFGWHTVGVEPSAAGRRGAVELGIDIRDGYVTTEPLVGGPFDVVLASEVLEHVEDPFGLLQVMRAQLSPGGAVVLTTPAAEAITPTASLQTVSEVLSVPYHHFVASVGGLDRLLRECGFAAVAVQRFASTLVAIARVEPGEISLPTPRSVDAQQMEAYYSYRAANAAPGSALQLGCATRAVRSMVARGAFDAAVDASTAMSAAFLARCGRPLVEPTQLTADIAGGWSPPLSLPGSAFATGMIEMLHTRRSSVAIEWFALAEAAAVQLRGSGQLVDVDSLDLVAQSLGHGALSAAAVVGGGPAAAASLDRLAAVLPRDEVSWWTCRVFVEAVSAGHFTDGEALVGRIAAIAHAVAASPVEGRRRAGLDALFTWGVLRLVGGNPREALQLFSSCAQGCGELAEPETARGLLAEAQRHVQLAREAMAGEVGQHHVVRRIEGGNVNAVIETYWSDAHGMRIEGWLVASGRRWVELGVRIGDVVHWCETHARPDVLALVVGAVDDRVGLAVYIDGGPTGAPIHFVGRTEQGELVEAPVALPSRALPIVEVAGRHLDFFEVAATAPPGPILIIGARAAEENTRLDIELRERSGREVVCVDIHPGIGVDVVADAHLLSEVFAADTFAVTTSAAVLEHLEAPWLVAAQCAAVTMTGGLAVHLAPFVWPAHAQPNDFWRFSPQGLAVLFGPAAGFEVLDSGSEKPAVVMPDSSWRRGHLSMPTLATNSLSWVVSRRAASPAPTMIWRYDAAAGAARAQQYPPSALSPDGAGEPPW
jgi:SAM-dependent methyltransferase